MWHYQTFVYTVHRQIQKSCIEIINGKYQEQHGMKSLNCVMDLIPYQTFNIFLNTYLNFILKEYETLAGKPPAQI